MFSIGNMGKFEEINNSSEVTMKNCSVVIKCEDCPICRRSFKCLTDVWDHISEVHYNLKKGSKHNSIKNAHIVKNTQIPINKNNNSNYLFGTCEKPSKKSSVKRKKKNIRLILKVGNEVMSSISLKRKYLEENIISISSKRNCISNGFCSHTKYDCPSNVVSNNLKIENDHQMFRIGITENQSIDNNSSSSICFKSNNTAKSEIDEKLKLLGNCFSIQRNDHGFCDTSQQQGSCRFDIDDKENKFKSIRGKVDTKINDKLNDSFSCSRNNVNSHYFDPISQNIELHTKQSPQSNMTQQNMMNTGQTCLITLENNRNKIENKQEIIELTPPGKNRITCNDINLSKSYCNNIKDNKECILDDEIQEISVTTSNTTIPFENKKEDISNNIYHTKGRMLLWNAIKEMRNMDCYMTEKEKSVGDINSERILSNRGISFPMSACI